MFFQGFQPQHVGLCVQEHVQLWFVFILKHIDQRLCVITLTPIGFTCQVIPGWGPLIQGRFAPCVLNWSFLFVFLCDCWSVSLFVYLSVCLFVCSSVLLFHCFIVMLFNSFFVWLFCCLLFVLLFVQRMHSRMHVRTHTHMIISTCKIDQREDKVRKQARSRRMCTVCRRVLQRDLRSRVALISVIGINESGSSFLAALQASAPWRRELLSELTKDKPMISHIAANSHPKTSYS